MRRKTCRKSGRLIPLLLAMVIIFGVLPMQVLAAETESAPLATREETEPDNTLRDARTKSCTVAFDPDNGASFNDFFKVTLPEGSKIESKLEDPTRKGYIFQGWYYALDEDGNPEFWSFETDTVPDHNITLWAAWEKGYIVAFDLDDGASFSDFFKVTLPAGSKIESKPEDPTRKGYIFKGWYYALDENGKPEFWNFETDTVPEHNITLWAAWEKGYIVAFDLDDGASFSDFFKVTLPAGSKIESKPEDPTRNGYIFKGWYYALGENGKPEFWSFETDTVPEHNITLWAAWEKGYIVAFDLDDGVSFSDFFKVTLPAGSKIESKPEDPTRNGYIFKGWYYALGENGKPEFWNFETDTVPEHNITLWAAWAKKPSTGGDPDPVKPDPEKPDPEKPDPEKPGPGGEPGNGGDGSIEIGDGKTPGGGSDLDDIPKTGDNGSVRLLLWLLCGISAFGMITLSSPRKKSRDIAE